MKGSKWKDQKGGGQCGACQVQKRPPLWICAVGTVETPSLVYQLGGGLCLPKNETSTAYNSDIRTRTIQKMKAWVSKVGETPMQQHPWSRKCRKEGENVSPDPREMPSASKILHNLV